LSSSFYKDNTDGKNNCNYNNNNKPSTSSSERISHEYGDIDGDFSGGVDRGNNNVNNNNNHATTTLLPSMRGDATVRPNTGNSNQSAGTVLGSLREIATFLRWTTIGSTIAAIIWEGFAFPMRFIGGSIWVHPAQVVLGAYLGFFCLLILGIELKYTPFQLQDNFGFLYDPFTRGFVLLMMSGMSIGILTSWWESLLGLGLGLVGIGYIYTYIKYPEYRRWQNYNERSPTAWQEAKMYWNNSVGGGEYSSLLPTAAAAASSWADPNNRDNNNNTVSSNLVGGIAAAQTASEVRSLLHQGINL